MPITKIDYVDMPFASPRVTPNRGALAALYVRQGENLAELALRKGENKARTFERLGQIYNGYTEQVRQQKAAEAALALRAQEREQDRAEKDKDRTERANERTEAARLTAAREDREAARYMVGNLEPGPVSPVVAEVARRFPELAARFSQRQTLPATVTPGAAGMVSPEQGAYDVLEASKDDLERSRAQLYRESQAAAALAARKVDDARMDAAQRQNVAYQNKSLEISQQNANTARQNAETNSGGDTNTDPRVADPTSRSILAQTGLSYPAFLVMTGDASKVARGRPRTDAMNEVEKFANSRGVDVSTFQSQAAALNLVLKQNTMRFNQVKVAEGELAATLGNLKSAAAEAGLDDARAFNAVKLFVAGEFNNADVQKYAFHLNQLRSELAFYNAATQGRAGNVFVQDYTEAERVLKQGVAAGSLDGLGEALNRSVDKMGTVLSGSVTRAQQDMWKLFGVQRPPEPSAGAGGAGMVEAIDAQGNVHHAPAGTPLPPGWKLKQ